MCVLTNRLISDNTRQLQIYPYKIINVMTKKIILSTFIFTVLTIFSCSKKDTPTNNNLTDTPAAKARYDATNFGIYKGVFDGFVSA